MDRAELRNLIHLRDMAPHMGQEQDLRLRRDLAPEVVDIQPVVLGAFHEDRDRMQRDDRARYRREGEARHQDLAPGRRTAGDEG